MMAAAKIGPKEAAVRALKEANHALFDGPRELKRGDPACPFNKPAPIVERPAEAPTPGTPRLVSDRPARSRKIELKWADGQAKGRHALYRCKNNGDGTVSLVVDYGADSGLQQETYEPVDSPARVAGQANEHEAKLRDQGAPVYKAPKAETESDMGKAKTKKAAGRNKARTGIKAKKTEGVRPGSKLEQVVKLLQRASGCTSKDVLKATGWPSVSMPQQAKAAGITLETEKIDGVTHYWDKATRPAKSKVA